MHPALCIGALARVYPPCVILQNVPAVPLSLSATVVSRMDPGARRVSLLTCCTYGETAGLTC